jgi:hypothetical protein
MTHPLLRYLKETPGETRVALCERADISRMTFWRLTNGKGEYSTTLLKRIEAATDGKVTVAEMIAALSGVEAA